MCNTCLDRMQPGSNVPSELCTSGYHVEWAQNIPDTRPDVTDKFTTQSQYRPILVKPQIPPGFYGGIKHTSRPIPIGASCVATFVSQGRGDFPFASEKHPPLPHPPWHGNRPDSLGSNSLPPAQGNKDQGEATTDKETSAPLPLPPTRTLSIPASGPAQEAAISALTALQLSAVNKLTLAHTDSQKTYCQSSIEFR